MSRTAAWTTALVILLASGCASKDPDRPRASNAGQQCFFAGNVSNFAAVDSSTVNIRVGSDVYRLDLMSSCRNVNWNNRLTLASRTGSSICTGTGLGTTLISRGVTGQQRCQVHRITLLTAAEVEALRPRDRP
jgi:hypothetical protein